MATKQSSESKDGILMNRRTLFGAGAAVILAGPPSGIASSLQDSRRENYASDKGTARRPVLVRSGFTRKASGKDERAPSPSGMFDTEVVRSSDSGGHLAIFVFPPGDHHPYRGAPLHVHHQQDEWIYVMTGEFVAEVGGEHMRLKPGDSLLMPMRVPHRWSVAHDPNCGAIHLYTPAGLMETEWSSVAQSEDPKNREARKAEFEQHGLTLLGEALSKEEIDRTL
jgi:mannose-6-phosphate isomerase-like protein (cupin superfamily)